MRATRVSSALAFVLGGRPTTAYWLQTGFIAVFFVWLVVFYFRSKGEA